MALLKFALLCIDLVGWPVIALVYPLFVSVRAVETGSEYHMRKIPFWSGVRLAVSFCLVMPQFKGACLAYQGLINTSRKMDQKLWKSLLHHRLAAL
ncbi:hypothetical protein AAHA92_30582 [Salvia divinorum]|uniref:Uncharacterized protein n=1 Tax=Salvia divinorum TaxID=28513 RepID=A0ABD1FRC8_SALDI